MVAEVHAGNTGILDLYVKIAGSQESVNEDLEGAAIITVNLPQEEEYYTFNEENLDTLSILDFVPTYDEANKTLTWILDDIETGISANVQIPINTNNGVTPNNTTLAFTASLAKADNTVLVGPKRAEFTIKADYGASVSKKYTGIVNSSAEAPVRGQSISWLLRGSVVLGDRKGMYMQPGTVITVTDVLPEGLEYVNSAVLKGDLGNPTIDGRSITWTATAPELEVQKTATAFVTVVPPGDNVEMSGGGNWYASVTGGPINGESKYKLVGNPNPAVNDTASLAYHAFYGIALNQSDSLTRDGSDARAEWNVGEVFAQGYERIVSKQTFSQQLLFAGVRVEVPKSYYHSKQQGKRLTTDPVVTIRLYLTDGTIKTHQVVFNENAGIHQVMVSRQEIGLADNERVERYEIEYANADGSPLFGGVALDTFPFFNVEAGYEGELVWQNVWEMTLTNGRTYIKSATETTDAIGPRTVQVIRQEDRVPVIKTGVRFTQRDGDIVSIGNNRVRHFMNSLYNSPANVNGVVSSVIVLPYGVKLRGDGDFKFEHQKFRLNVPPDTITGSGEVIDENYAGRGQQLVKVVWNKDIIYPYDQLTVEFDVEITKDAPKRMEMVSYTASTGTREISAASLESNPVEVDTDDINRDGISAPQKWIKASTGYSLRSKEDLKTEKFVKGSLDADFSRFAKTSLGGDIEYRIHLTNTTGRNISTLGFIDVLPSVGDVGIVDNIDRGSAFTPLLKGPVTLPAEWVDKVEVYYSTSRNPQRADLYNKVMYPTGAFTHVDPDTAQEPNWTKEVTDWSSIHSFKLELKEGTIWVKGQDISLSFTMVAPQKGDTTNLPDESILFSDINDGNRDEQNESKAAWNSFAISANGLLPTEPERVGVVLFEKGGAVRVKYFIEGTETELYNPVAGTRVPAGNIEASWYTIKAPGSAIGEFYQSNNATFKPLYLRDENGNLYKLTGKELRDGSASQDGSVQAGTQYIMYEYALLQKSDESESEISRISTSGSHTADRLPKTGDVKHTWIYGLFGIMLASYIIWNKKKIHK